MSTKLLNYTGSDIVVYIKEAGEYIPYPTMVTSKNSPMVLWGKGTRAEDELSFVTIGKLKEVVNLPPIRTGWYIVVPQAVAIVAYYREGRRDLVYPDFASRVKIDAASMTSIRASCPNVGDMAFTNFYRPEL